MTNSKPNIFLQFLSFLWRSFNATGKFFLYFFVLLFTIVFLSALLGEEPMEVPDGAALVLRPSGAIVEQLDHQSPLDEAFGMSETRPKQTLLKDILVAIERAKEDDRIKGMVISTKLLASAPISKLQEIGAAIEEFKTSGKKVISYSELATQQRYYLAAHADEVYLGQYGMVNIDGYGIFRTYFKGLLDKFGINYHIFKVGTFKSAVEPFLRKDMSEEARLANRAFLDDLWSEFKAGIAKQRNLTPEHIDTYADEMLTNLQSANGNTAVMAMNSQLVDGIKNRIEMKKYLIELFGENKKGTNFNGITHEHYLKATYSSLDVEKPDGAKIGVIVAKGTIMDGNHKEGKIGGDTIAALIAKARQDDNIKAIVLRVDSGGGSATASEVIREEILETKAAGKPVVVSMGSYAASGGYLISADADEIWASPSTVTGSIGVFAMLPTFEKPANEYLNIYRDGIGTNKLTGGFDVIGGIDPQIKQSIQLGVESFYDQFLTIVANGRNMTKEAVDKIGQGRVWSGKKAMEIGLVDKLGNLDDAVRSAASLAKLEQFDVSYIERELSPKEQFVKNLLNTYTTTFGSEPLVTHQPGLIESSLGKLQDSLNEITTFNDPVNLYTHCLCEVQ